MIDIGVDIENIKRFEKYSMPKDLYFLEQIYTKKELEYCFSNRLPAKHLAARFCAKEAFYKAYSSYNSNLKLKDIEILNDNNGNPFFNIKNLTSVTAKLSLSHDKEKAVAFVIIQQ